MTSPTCSLEKPAKDVGIKFVFVLVMSIDDSFNNKNLDKLALGFNLSISRELRISKNNCKRNKYQQSNRGYKHKRIGF